MRNLLALVGLVVVGFGGVGWYMGWYTLSFSRTADGNLQINTTVDTHKAAEESSDLLKKAGTAIGNHVDKAAQEAQISAPNAAPGGTPGPLAPSVQPPPSIPLPEIPLVPGPTPKAPPPVTAGPIPLIPPK